MHRWIYSLCAVAITVFLCRWIEAGRELTLAQKGAASSAIHLEGERTREWLEKNAVPLLSDTVKKADARTAEALGIVRDLGKKADGIAKRANALLDRTERDANARLEEVTAAAGELAGIRQDLQPVLAELQATIAAPRSAFINAGLITDEIHKALAANMDPTKPASWPSRVTGIMGSANTLMGESALTMRTWRKETPAIAGNVAGITENAREITKPRRWYWKVGAIAGAVVGGIVAAKVK